MPLLIFVAKLWNLILRQSQQKRIQDLAESLTLYLADVKPLRWFKSLQIAELNRFLIAFSAVSCVGAVLALPVVQTSNTGSFDGKFLFYSMFAGVLVNLLLAITLGRRAVTWLLAGHAPCKFLRRYLISTVVFVVVLILCHYLVWTLVWLMFPVKESLFSFYKHASHLNYPTPWWIYVIYSILLPSSFFGTLVLGIGVVAILALIALSILQVLIRMFVALAYRLVEYKNGVFSAIGEIVAATLWIVDVALRAGHLRDLQTLYNVLSRPAAVLGACVCGAAMLGFEQMISTGSSHRRWAAAAALGFMLLMLILAAVALGAISREFQEGLAHIAIVSGSLITVGLVGLGIRLYFDQRRV